jgi:LuxR family maltose regulon positive regulatory protein
MTAISRMWRGLPDDSAQMARDAVRWVEAWDPRNATGRPLAGLPYSVLADVHREWNELDAAESFAALAIDHGKRGLFLSFFESTKALERLAEARSDWETASRCVADAMRGVLCTGNTWWQLTMQAIEQRMLLRRGQRMGIRADVDGVAGWVEKKGLLNDWDTWESRRLPGWWPDLTFLIAARVLIDQGRMAPAVDLLNRLLRFSAGRQRVLGQIEILILRGIAEAGLSQVERAIATMTEALNLAARPRYVRLFLEEGSAVAPLVERAMPFVQDRDLGMKVLAAFDVPVSKSAAAAANALSDREIEVLGLIARGVSNQVAGQKLFISPSTVKKHLENIYSKLQVGGRVEAIARARELKIL